MRKFYLGMKVRMVYWYLLSIALLCPWVQGMVWLRLVGASAGYGEGVRVDGCASSGRWESRMKIEMELGFGLTILYWRDFRLVSIILLPYLSRVEDNNTNILVLFLWEKANRN